MKALLKAALVLVLVVLGYWVGFGWREIRTGHLPTADTVRSLLSKPAKLTPTELFRHHYNLLLTRFYRDLDHNKLKWSAMEGLFAALGDPHTMFMEPSVSKDFNIETHGDFVGIGARLTPDPLGARVVTVFKNGPAEKAMVQPGDIIAGVGSQDVTGRDVEDIVALIRGEPGTPVVLRLVRRGAKAPITVKVVRARVTVPTVETRMLEGTTIGYMTITQFAEITTEQFEQGLDEVGSHSPSGLIIDLRGNPGGLLETAAEMLGQFVSGKTVVTMKFRSGKQEVVNTPEGETRTFNYPVVLLINEDSASAAEIFSGVLHDYRKATLVGEHTYGKASVQNVFNLTDQSSAKIAVARYSLPSGTEFSRRVDEEGQYIAGGLKPDVLAPFDTSMEDSADDSATPVMGSLKTDSQLRKAVEVIKQKQGQSVSLNLQKPTDPRRFITVVA